MSDVTRARAAVCERHGLRFDPEQHDGCVLCRRERGEGQGRPAPEASSGRAWVVAALLWLVAGGALYVAHREVLAAFSPFLAAADSAFGDEENETGSREDSDRAVRRGGRAPSADEESIADVGDDESADGDAGFEDDGAETADEWSITGDDGVD